MKIRVLRPHGVNPFYDVGDVVDRDEDDAMSLIRSGLAEDANKAKADAPKNKAKADAPENKSK